MEINLSDDLIREILLRLPRRSLARFKSVSKPWLTTISSPYFIKQYDTMNLSSFFSFVHVDHENDNNGFQQKQQLYSLRTALGTPRFSPEIKKIVTVDSSNGLILYGAAVDLKERFGTYHSFFVTNPQTNQCRFLPPSPNSVSLDQPLPRYVEITTGFGFDHSSDPPHYIVVEIVPTDPFELEIYSYNSVTSAWTCNRANLRMLFKSSRTISISISFPFPVSN
ncbi:F-box domain containing protein [Parasponia andersonii]|uniref:F-box domain containing protein n=1 Tax=Parasponia andersonii TaxID=3476 RepID=A0A2P5DAV6_PARAD|nr:F-box domain containing protein [Parasponia andersonii]